MKNVIMELIAYEPNLLAKLEMLTAIGLQTQNDEVWNTSEEIRNELCPCEEDEGKVRDSLPQPRFEASFVPGPGDENYGADGAGLFT